MRQKLAHRIVAIVEEDGPNQTERGDVIRRRLNRRGALCSSPWLALVLDDDDERAERYTFGSVVIEITAARDTEPTRRPRRRPR